MFSFGFIQWSIGFEGNTTYAENGITSAICMGTDVASFTFSTWQISDGHYFICNSACFSRGLKCYYDENRMFQI